MKKVKHVSFIGPNQSDERDRGHMEYWKEQGWSYESRVEQIRNDGQKIKENEFAWAFNLARDSDSIVNNHDLTEDELRAAHTKFSLQIKRLKAIVSGAMDIDPDKANFAAPVRVTYDDGQEEIINEGINEKIYSKYKKTAADLEQAITVIDSRLKHTQHTGQGMGDNLIKLETCFEKLLFIKYCGMLQWLCTVYKKKDGSPNSKKMARLISHITDESASNIESYMPYLLDSGRIGAGHDNLYNEKALRATNQAIHDNGIDIPHELQNLLDNVETNRNN